MPPPNETKRKQGSFLILFLLAVGFAKPCLARDIGEVFHNTTDGSAPSPPSSPPPVVERDSSGVFTDGSAPPLPSSPPAPSAAEETTSPSPTDGDGGEGMMNSAEMPTSAAVAPPLLDDLDADGDEADAASKAGDQQGTEQISPQEGGEELVFVIHGFPKCRHCDDAQLAKRSDDSLLNDTRFNTPPRGFVELTEERVFDQRTGALMSTTGDYGRPLYNDTQTFRFTVDVAKGYKEIFYLTYWLKVYLDKVYSMMFWKKPKQLDINRATRVLQVSIFVRRYSALRVSAVSYLRTKVLSKVRKYESTKVPSKVLSKYFRTKV